MGCNSSQSAQVVENNTTPAPAPAPAPVARKEANSGQNNTKSKKYKLIYFDVPGRGELIRLIFHATKTQFEDCRIDQKEWENMKSKTPLGQLPVLEVDDKPLLCQSIAIARYAAKEVGLAGKDSIEMAKIDAVADTLTDLVNEMAVKIFPQMRNPTDDKEQIFEDFAKNTVPKYLNNIQTLMGLYGSNGYLVGDKLSWVDLYFYVVVGNLYTVSPFVLENYKNLGANRDLVSNNANLREYLKKNK